MTFYDSHAHVFNYLNVPDGYLGVKLDLSDKIFKWFTDKFGKVIPGTSDRIESINEFVTHLQSTPEDNLKNLYSRYPDKAVINVLLMDLISMNGEIKENYEQQILRMIELKKLYKDRLNLFMHLDYNRENMMELFEDYFMTENSYFKGVKLYPSLNCPVGSPKFDPIFKYCEEKRIPIITHAGAFGVTGNTVFRFMKNRHSSPIYWVDILKRYPDLKVDFAHFGDMDLFWQVAIIELMKTYPNVYTDVSWIIGETWKLQELGMIVKNISILQDRLLYGSDYYMVDICNSNIQENMLNLARVIGTKLFLKISTENPVKFLN